MPIPFPYWQRVGPAELSAPTFMANQRTRHDVPLEILRIESICGYRLPHNFACFFYNERDIERVSTYGRIRANCREEETFFVDLGKIEYLYRDLVNGNGIDWPFEHGKWPKHLIPIGGQLKTGTYYAIEAGLEESRVPVIEIDTHGSSYWTRCDSVSEFLDRETIRLITRFYDEFSQNSPLQRMRIALDMLGEPYQTMPGEKACFGVPGSLLYRWRVRLMIKAYQLSMEKRFWPSKFYRSVFELVTPGERAHRKDVERAYRDLKRDQRER